MTDTRSLSPACFTDDLFAGSSAAIERLRLQSVRIAPHFRIALITGEAGSGKQALALALHRQSAASDAPFVAQSAADWVDGRMDPLPDNAACTLYLSGIETLSLSQQDKMLEHLHVCRAPALPRRVQDAVAVAGRLVLGSSVDLRGLVAVGRIRPEFFSRIATPELRLPPLRERLEDIQAIASGMLRQMGISARLSQAAVDALEGHTWPGNMAELRQFLERLRGLEDVVEPSDLPPFTLAAPETRTLRLEDVLQRHVADVLQRCAGNKLRAAELLGISRSKLYRMLETMAA